MNRTLLALDLGTVTGFAVGDAAFGLPRLGTKTMPRQTSIGYFLKVFDEWLQEMIAVHAPRYLVVEAALVRGQNAPSNLNQTEKLVGLYTHCALAAEQASPRIPFDKANIGTVKNYFAGHGHADKRAMEQAARARGFTPANNNEADAAGVFCWYVHKRKPEWAERFFALTPTSPPRRKAVFS